MIKKYKGYTLENAAGGWQDWNCTFIERGEPRTRWGTLQEIREDVDTVISGNALPAKELGSH